MPDRSARRVITRLLSVASLCGAFAWPASSAGADLFEVHGQATYVAQRANAFRSPYRGENSLTPGEGRETADVTLYLGWRPWAGAELWVTPELDQGFGLDDTVGVAGFPSGEAYKVGKSRPYFQLPRAYLRQTLEDWVITVGKFAVTDVFDANTYAHDPRSDFLNWAAIDAGTFDYAADAWGLTLGASAEWRREAWTLRAGFFDLSDVPNSEHYAKGFREFQLVGEIERRHEWRGRAGKILVTAYQSRGRMGRLEDAIRVAEANGSPIDIAATRRFRSRNGISASIEQQFAPDAAMFARVGVADGSVEAYEFTDIDRAFALGVSLEGARWRRPDDTVGVVALRNEISATRRRYLDAGGLGILVGDGQLPHPGAERIVEAYYAAKVRRGLTVTADFQRIVNPAYNRDRGPVSVVALRIHAQL